MKKDIRREQLELLKFEKELAALAATFVGGAGIAAATSSKIGDDVSLTVYEDVRVALIQLAEATSRAHAAVEEVALKAGANYLQATGGLPKQNPAAEIVRSLLGAG